jgi:hypothetical protein
LPANSQAIWEVWHWAVSSAIIMEMEMADDQWLVKWQFISEGIKISSTCRRNSSSLQFHVSMGSNFEVRRDFSFSDQMSSYIWPVFHQSFELNLKQNCLHWAFRFGNAALTEGRTTFTNDSGYARHLILCERVKASELPTSRVHADKDVKILSTHKSGYVSKVLLRKKRLIRV